MYRNVLVIADDPDQGELVRTILQPLGISVHIANNRIDGLKQTYMLHPDLVILDTSVHGMDGFDVCTRLREFSNMPIMMISGRRNENDILRVFNAGANDYLNKPYIKTELEARVLALLKRANEHNPEETAYINQYADSVLEIDLMGKAVKLNGTFVNLSPREYDLLECMVQRQGKIVSQRELVRDAWGDLSINDLSEISLYIFYLRKKIRDGQFGHQYIRTFWGRGYWFEPQKNL